MAFIQIDPKSITDNPVELIGDSWGLLAAGEAGDCNAMTVSWGAMGVMWSAPAVTVYVRQSRYTKGFMDKGELFTLSFFDEDYRDALALCGRVSGRDRDKIAEAGLTPVDLGGVAGFEQARLVLVCRKQFAQVLEPESFIDREVIDRCYPDGDWHTMYIGRVEAVYTRA